MTENTEAKPSIKLKLVAIWLWINSICYLLNSFVFAGLILTLVYLELSVNGTRFVILQNNYFVILFPLIYAFIAFLYQYSSFALLRLTKKAFYLSLFLLFGHFIFVLSTVWTMGYFLSAMSNKDIISTMFTSITSINPLLILPVICIILLVLSKKEFGKEEKNLSVKAKVSITIFSLIPVVLSILLILWGSIDVLGQDDNSSTVQSQVSYTLYKPSSLPVGMTYAVKFTKKDDGSVNFMLKPSDNSMSKVITVIETSSTLENTDKQISNLTTDCNKGTSNCTFQDLNIPLSKTSIGKYVSTELKNQYSIIFDTESGTTIAVGIYNLTTKEAVDFINTLK